MLQPTNNKLLNALLFSSVQRSLLSLVTSSWQVTRGWRPLPAQCYGVSNRTVTVARVSGTCSTGHFFHCCACFRVGGVATTGSNTSGTIGKESSWAGKTPMWARPRQITASNSVQIRTYLHIYPRHHTAIELLDVYFILLELWARSFSFTVRSRSKIWSEKQSWKKRINCNNFTRGNTGFLSLSKEMFDPAQNWPLRQ